MKILVVDDDHTLLRSLTIGLRAWGHQVIPVGDVRSAQDAIRYDEPELVILDLGLPDGDGIDLLSQVRAGVGVIVLSARSDSAQKVLALDLGAEDYVTKPFSMDELLARVRVAERRRQGRHAMWECAEFRIDFDAGLAEKAGIEVRLTPTEWGLLQALAATPGQLVRRADLLHAVWGPNYDRETNYLRVYFAGLRKKLEADPARPRHIVTVPGMGYRLDP